jgi:nitrogenase molybdenum-iron protein alpha/beta subunit
MLLRHTTKEVKERKALTINPAKTCQPIGAMYAALGITDVCLTVTAHRDAAPITEAP